MLYCTKCKSICEDSTRACPGCKRTRGLRPVRDSDEVFLKVSEGEAVELAELFDSLAIRHRIEPVKSGFTTSVYDPEYMPTDKNIYVDYQDLARANEAMAQETQDEPAPEQDDMPGGKRLLIQSLSIIAFMALVILVVLGTDFVANLLKELFMK